MRIKTLYISDLDGTLLNKSAELSPRSARVLNEMRSRGQAFTFATARTPATACAIMAAARVGAPAVLMNGVLVYDLETREYAQIHTLPREATARICPVLAELNAPALMYELRGGEQTTYYRSTESAPLKAFIESRVSKYGKVFKETGGFADVPPDAIIYFSVLDTYENALRVRDAIKDVPGIGHTIYADVYNDGLWFLEVYAELASKRGATAFLRERYGFERVVGFGDNLNDLPLFAACDVRVAVANARDEVKNAADFICGACDDDGVAKWLEANAL